MQAALFLGAALSITAFPVMARILHERGLTGTPIGTMALAAGAMGDVAAWLIFAIVVASFKGDASVAVAGLRRRVRLRRRSLRIRLRPYLRRLAAQAEAAGEVSQGTVGILLMLLMLGAWFTDRVGVHAVFGAFILGTAVPRGLVSRELQRAIGPLTIGLLVPLFFVYSGLHTQLGLVDTAGLWLVTAVIFAVACLGKGVACWLAARLNGASAAEALGIGTLMNARGMMELILLNIGLRARPDHADAVHHPGADDAGHDADGVAALRPGLPPIAGSRALRRGRGGSRSVAPRWRSSSTPSGAARTTPRTPR